MMRRLTVLASTLLVTAPAAAQDANFLYPMPRIEQLLRADDFQIIDVHGARAEGDRTQRVTVQYSDGTVMIIKWANAARGGHAFNNAPRYEAAAYELQRLFLPADEYVVPPTVLRAFPVALARVPDEDVRATFDGAESVLTLLQYWMSAVTNENFWDEDRFEADTVYARYFANMNILTHLIDHRDANVGNFLVSRMPQKPRVFAVDNGVAFRSQRSNRGTEWGRLRIDRLPRATVERLRAVTDEQLHGALEVIAEFVIRGGLLESVPPGANLDDGKGVREEDGRVQLGLTRHEISDVSRRLRDLLKRIDDGKIEVF